MVVDIKRLMEEIDAYLLQSASRDLFQRLRYRTCYWI